MSENLGVPSVTIDSDLDTPEVKEDLSKLWEYGLQFKEQTESWIINNLPFDWEEIKKISLGIQHNYYWIEEKISKYDNESPGFKDDPDISKMKRCVIHYDGDFTNESYIQKFALGELISNCARQGASYIYVVYRPGMFILADDVEYSSKDLAGVVKYLNQKYVKSTKDTLPGGLGIGGIRRTILDQYNPDPDKRVGSLRYATDGKRVFTIMLWNKEKLKMK